MQWRLQSPKQKQLIPEPTAAGSPGNDREKREAHPSPSSQLAEFRPDRGGGGEVVGGRRGRKVTPVPPPTRAGRWRGRGGGGGRELEAIPEVASSHSLQETTFW